MPSLTKFSIFRLNQVNRKDIAMKVKCSKCFICTDSSDEQSAFEQLCITVWLDWKFKMIQKINTYVSRIHVFTHIFTYIIYVYILYIYVYIYIYIYICIYTKFKIVYKLTLIYNIIIFMILNSWSKWFILSTKVTVFPDI